jgi:pyrroloquinoline quinone (PQQ) biosynthesis protein C
VSELLSPEELEAALRAIGKVRYHNNHPFHGLLHSGKLNKGQVQAWRSTAISTSRSSR